MVEILNTRRFKDEFLRSLSREFAELSIVSPFVNPIPGFDSTHKFFSFLSGRYPEASLSLVTRPPNDRRPDVLSWQAAELIASIGVDLKIRPNPTLHSKVYYFRYVEGDSSSFVGSANFTKGGFERNDETMAFWRRGESNAKVESELARLSGRGSYDFMDWKVERERIAVPAEEEDAD